MNLLDYLISIGAVLLFYAGITVFYYAGRAKVSANKEALLTLTLPRKPEPFEPVLARIKYLEDTGVSNWAEVVYMDDDGRWRAYYGSDTFTDGHQVVEWVYVHEAFKNKN